jgi:hypothetical protein
LQKLWSRESTSKKRVSALTRKYAHAALACVCARTCGRPGTTSGRPARRGKCHTALLGWACRERCLDHARTA